MIHNGPSQPGYRWQSNFCRNCSRSHEDSPNQVQALPHTTQNSPRSHIAISKKKSRRRRHPPTTPNDPSPPGYCQHSNSCGNCLRTCKDTSNLVRGPTYTFRNHTTIFLEDQSLTNCHNTISSHNVPSLTTLSSCVRTPP